MTLPFAHCHQDVDLGLNFFPPNVGLWNGIRGYHYTPNVLVQQSMGQGNVLSINWLIVIQRVII
jgi:hypothetical protein